MTDAKTAIARFANWMTGEALPFWADVGLSPEGGVVERMTLEGRPERTGYKRVRVHARQIYVFSHAHVLGHPGMAAAAEAGVKFLLAHGRDDDGGWVVKMGETGGIVDSNLDLYDQAFVILALAWWSRAGGGCMAIDLAHETLAMIERRFARPDGKGYRSCCPDSDEALQNPHMHLLEALLALNEVAPDDPAGPAIIGRLLSLFKTTLFDAETATLGEIFATDWRPAPGAAGDLTEPGHHYEWYWLLHTAQRRGFGTAEPEASALFAFAERYGLEADTTLIHDALGRNGRVLSTSHRSWHQTERLKALVVRGEGAHNEWDEQGIVSALGTLHRFYIDPAPRGCWIDHVDAQGAPKVDYVPASTLYHLFLAHAELERVLGCRLNSSNRLDEQ